MKDDLPPVPEHLLTQEQLRDKEALSRDHAKAAAGKEEEYH